MEKSQKYDPTKGKETLLPEPPTREQVRDWVKRDLSACHYFLGALLRYPDVIQELADGIYDHANKVENGSAIDHKK